MIDSDGLPAVGFYRELAYGQEDEPSLADVMGRGDPAIKEQVLDYLAAGEVVEIVFTVSTDVLDETAAPIGPLRILSDGAFVWPSDLAHYVEHYDVALPHEFVAHMKARNWEPSA